MYSLWILIIKFNHKGRRVFVCPQLYHAHPALLPSTELLGLTHTDNPIRGGGGGCVHVCAWRVGGGIESESLCCECGCREEERAGLDNHRERDVVCVSVCVCVCICLCLCVCARACGYVFERYE